MLVLSRKIGEQIHVGPSITVTVVEVNGGRVRLGIAAPQEVQIFRAELQDVLSRVGAEEPLAAPLAS
jgi:carbon storage regulator